MEKTPRHFRTHQFNKIEQFVFCTPEQSWKLHEELVENAENLIQKLGLAYRVVNVCTGTLGLLLPRSMILKPGCLPKMPIEKLYRAAIAPTIKLDA